MADHQTTWTFSIVADAGGEPPGDAVGAPTPAGSGIRITSDAGERWFVALARPELEALGKLEEASIATLVALATRATRTTS